MKSFVRAVVLLPFLGCAAPAARRDLPPNLVFILLDNVGQEWFGCYGSEEGATPNIDALARTGARAEHCYAPPVCGPSRVVLLTGRYPFRTGWTVHHDAALYGGGGLDPAREVVLARPFREAGYATGIVGKWQINNLYDEPDALRRHGFDEHLAWPGSIDADRVRGPLHERFLEAIRQKDADYVSQANRDIESRYWDPVLIRNGRRETHPGRFGPDVLQEYALGFLKRHRGRPFLLYYPMVLTHGKSFLEPVAPTPQNLGRERTEQESFADMLRYADRLVGELVRTLEELGLRERTYVFVASDNGTEKRFSARRSGRRVQGGLYQLSEAGGSVVLIANCPARIPGGRTWALADFSDVYPTLCELAGVPPPRGVALDGRSLAAFLRGDAPDSPRRWIFNQYHTRRVVRDGRHKLYSTGELYDVLEDPDEVRDLGPAGAAEARRRLQEILVALPPDTRLPFEPRSISMFRIAADERKSAPK